MIDLFYPYVPEEAVLAAGKTLCTRWIGQGPKVEEFEKVFSRKFQETYSVSMNSCSAALETAYELAGITNGDEVLSTILTCTATNIPLLRLGAKIIWVDINPETLCMDINDLKRKLTPRSKAIVNVHLGGIDNSFNNTEIPVPVISDSAQALGVFSGKWTCCSFQAIKHISTGDGGMLVCSDKQDYHKAKLMRWFGIDREKKSLNNWQAYKERAMTFDIELLGYKRQMTDLAAVLGIEGLKKYDYVINYRKKLFNTYKRLLSGFDGVKIIDGKKNTYWLCTVLVERRDDFAKMLFAKGVDTNIVQVRNDIYKIFGGKRMDLPVMNDIEFKYISLPLHMKLTGSDVKYICSCIKKGW